MLITAAFVIIFLTQLLSGVFWFPVAYFLIFDSFRSQTSFTQSGRLVRSPVCSKDATRTHLICWPHINSAPLPFHACPPGCTATRTRTQPTSPWAPFANGSTPTTTPKMSTESSFASFWRSTSTSTTRSYRSTFLCNERRSLSVVVLEGGDLLPRSFLAMSDRGKRAHARYRFYSKHTTSIYTNYQNISIQKYTQKCQV